MKAPVKSSHLLAGGLLFSITALLLLINGLPIAPKNTSPDFAAKGPKTLRLSGHTLVRQHQLKKLKGIDIHAQFVDSILLVPSARPFVEIQGDAALVNNLQVHYRASTLYLIRKYYYPIEGLDDKYDFYQFNFPGRIDRGGLFIKIGFTDQFNSLFVEAEPLLIRQEGVLSAKDLTINAIAEVASFQVETQRLRVDLTKPTTKVQLDTLNNLGEYRTLVAQSLGSLPHRVKGTADLVELSRHYHGPVNLDLTELSCRHVHADFRHDPATKRLAVAPTQLFSYVTQQRLPQEKIQLICKSQAKITRAYLDEAKGVIRY